VLSLGAGFDTTAFTLAATGCAPHLFCEVDFFEVRPPPLAPNPPLTPARQTAARKAAAIARVPALRDALGGAACVQDGPASITAPRYALRAADLRLPGALAAVLQAVGMVLEAPTFILLECVLVYMEPDQAAALLAWAAAAFPTAAVLVYDPTRPDDPFGTQMRLNLAARGCPLRGIASGATPAAHAARLLTAGWQRSEAADMLEVYERVIPQALRARAERCEWLDEVEEWVLIQRHYALALGVNDAAGLLQGLTLGCGSDGDRERRNS